MISDKIFELLQKRSMTQKTFSQKTGISQSTISDWKHKGLNPSSDKILIICDVLEVNPYELLSYGESEKFQQIDYAMIGKNSDEFTLLEKYKSLTAAQKERVIGYVDALLPDSVTEQ